jgi:hypothetical protein
LAQSTKNSRDLNVGNVFGGHALPPGVEAWAVHRCIGLAVSRQGLSLLVCQLPEKLLFAQASRLAVPRASGDYFRSPAS